MGMGQYHEDDDDTAPLDGDLLFHLDGEFQDVISQDDRLAGGTNGGRGFTPSSTIKRALEIEKKQPLTMQQTVQQARAAVAAVITACKRLDLESLAVRLAAEHRYSVVLRTAVQLSGAKGPAVHSIKHSFLLLQPNDSSAQVIVDPTLREHFCLGACPDGFKRVIRTIPGIFVGSLPCLAAVVTAATERMHQCLSEVGLTLPPWRSVHVLMSKWRPECYQDCIYQLTPQHTPSAVGHKIASAVVLQAPGSNFTATAALKVVVQQLPIKRPSTGATSKNPGDFFKRPQHLQPGSPRAVIHGFKPGALSVCDHVHNSKGSKPSVQAGGSGVSTQAMFGGVRLPPKLSLLRAALHGTEGPATVDAAKASVMATVQSDVLGAKDLNCQQKGVHVISNSTSAASTGSSIKSAGLHPGKPQPYPVLQKSQVIEQLLPAIRTVKLGM